MPSSSDLHQPLLNLIESRLAIILHDHRAADILHVVEEMVRVGEIRDENELIKLLSEQMTITTSLWQRIIQAATIGETYFFRDRSQLNALTESVLPNLIKERMESGRKVLRIWSAGCSTGEEPYSLAIILRDLIPDIESWDISILATDLNTSHLERAQRGIYRPWSFRSEIAQDCKEKWFVEAGGSFRIDPSIRKMVTFSPLNLASDIYPSYNTQTIDIDIILCRNVLIYFDNPTVEATIKRLNGALCQKGWLIIGHSESHHMAKQAFQARNFDGAVLYQKALTPAQNFLSMPETIEFRLTPIPELAFNLPEKSSMPIYIPQPVPVSVSVPTVSPDHDPLKLAQQAADREEWAEALLLLNEAETEHKFRPEVHYLRGIIELQQGDIDKALSSLRRAIYCNPNFILAHVSIGDIFEKQGQLKKAINQWRQVQILLRDMPQDEIIDSGDSLTVNMLETMLDYRLGNLADKWLRQ